MRLIIIGKTELRLRIREDEIGVGYFYFYGKNLLIILLVGYSPPTNFYVITTKLPR